MVFISHIPDGAEGGVCFAALQHKTFTLFVYNYKTQKGNKMPSKFIRILRITFCYKQLCGRCLVHTTPVVKVVTHCVFALL